MRSGTFLLNSFFIIICVLSINLASAQGEPQFSWQRAVGASALNRNLALSPDGNLLATPSAGFILMDSSTGNVRSRSGFYTDYGFVGRGPLAFSPDGSMIASGGDYLAQWNVSDGSLQRTAWYARWPTTTVVYASDNEIVAGQTNGNVILVRALDGAVNARYPGHQGAVSALAYDPQRGIIASAGVDRKVLLREESTGRNLATLEGGNGILPGNLAFSPNGDLLACGNSEGTVSIWSLDGNLLRILPGQSPVLAISFSPDSSRLATGLQNGSIVVWDIAGGLTVLSFPAHKGGTNGLVYSLNGAELFSCGADSLVKRWDASNGVLHQLLTSRGGEIAFSPSEQTILACDGNVNLINAEDGSIIRSIGGSRNLHATFIGDGTTVGLAGEDFVDVRRTSDGALLHSVSTYRLSSGRQCAFSPDGKYYARQLQPEGSEIQVIRVTDGHVNYIGARIRYRNLFAIAPNNRFMASIYADRISIEPFASQVLLRSLKNPDGGSCVTVSPDSETIAVGSDRGIITLWRVADGDRIARLQGNREPIRTVAFARDGRTLIAFGGSGGVDVWDVAQQKQTHYYDFSNDQWEASLVPYPDGSGAVYFNSLLRSMRFARSESVAFPTDLRITGGELGSGSVKDLEYLGGFALMEGHISTHNPMVIDLESRVSETYSRLTFGLAIEGDFDLDQMLELYNFRTGAFVLIDARQCPDRYSWSRSRFLFHVPNGSEFVEPNTGRVKARITIRPLVDWAAFISYVYLDQVFWKFEE